MSELEQVLRHLVKINGDLKTQSDPSAFQQDLQVLGGIIQYSANLQDASLRNQFLANYSHIFPIISQIFDKNDQPAPQDENLVIKLRIVRGVIILVRNVLAVSDQVIENHKLFYDQIIETHKLVLRHFVFVVENYFAENKVLAEDFLVEKLAPCYLQCLSNLSGNFQRAIIETIPSATAGNPESVSADLISTRESDYKDIIQSLNDLSMLDERYNFFGDFSKSTNNYHLFLIYVNQFIINNYTQFNHKTVTVDEDEFTNNFIYYLLNNTDNIKLIEKLSDQFVKHHDALHFNEEGQLRSTPEEDNKIIEVDAVKEQELQRLELSFYTFTSIIKNIVVHESFGKFLTQKYDETKLAQNLLKASQILFTNLDKYTNLKLVIILIWVMDLFDLLLKETEQYFDSANETSAGVDVSKLNGNLFIALDILTHFLVFDYVIQYLNNYKFLIKLILLAKILQKHIKPISKLSDTDRGTKLSDPRNFPNIKKLIIESITYLVYNNFENQELVRETQGLEVVLSNCIIDELNPFIKETAIVCIKYLMKDNQKNQEFVRKLEAKKVVNEEELKGNGVEIEMADGKVKFKKNSP